MMVIPGIFWSVHIFHLKFLKYLSLQLVDFCHVRSCGQHVINIQQQYDIWWIHLFKITTMIHLYPFFIINLSNLKYHCRVACFRPYKLFVSFYIKKRHVMRKLKTRSRPSLGNDIWFASIEEPFDRQFLKVIPILLW